LFFSLPFVFSFSPKLLVDGKSGAELLLLGCWPGVSLATGDDY
jgi:hypothetical protein